MDISSRFSPYGRLALNKSIINKDGEKGGQQSPELDQNGGSKEGGENIITVDADALTLLAMQNKGLMNVQTPTAADATPATNTPTVSNAPTMNAPAANDSSSVIDIDSLFNGADSINSKDLIARFNSWKNSTNPSEQQLYDLFSNALKRFNIIDNNSDYQNCNLQLMFDAFIKLLNETVGSENTKPLTLKQETINKLNQNDPFGTIESILNSTNFETEYFVGSIDGEINDFHQGIYGDCGFLAGVLSLNATEYGKTLIKNAIVDNGNGSYTVKFSGIGEEYTFSTEDIKNYKIQNKYLAGDGDALLLELAFMKLYDSVVANQNFKDYLCGFNGSNNNEKDCFKYVSSPCMIGYFLSGTAASEFITEVNESMLSSIYDDFKNNNYGIEIDGGFGDEPIYDIYGNVVDILSAHQKSIVDINMDSNNPAEHTITIMDSTRPGKQFTINLNEFLNRYQGKMNIYLLPQADENSMKNNQEKFIGLHIEQFREGNIKIDELLGDIRDILKPNTSVAITNNAIIFDINGKHYEISYDATGFVDVNITSSEDYLYSKVKNIINEYCKNKSNSTENIIKLLGSIEGIENLGYSSNPIFDNDGNFSGSKSKIEFDFQGKHYIIEQIVPRDPNLRDGTRELYDNEQISKYTTDQSIINKYFEVAATVDGQPLVYRLKDGMSFDDFKKEANKNRWTYNPNITHKAVNERAIKSETINKDLNTGTNNTKSEDVNNNLHL